MPRTPEQKLWHKYLKPALDRIPGLVYERIELKTGASGMPDVMYSYCGTGFIEMKVCPTDILNLNKWTGPQRRWAKQHGEAGAKVLLLVGTPGFVTLLDAVKLVKCGMGSYSDSLWCWCSECPIVPDELQLVLKVNPLGGN